MTTLPDDRPKYWPRLLLNVLLSWGRHQIWNVALAIVGIWICGAITLHYVEPADNASFSTWGASLWNVWLALFSGANDAPRTIVGRFVVGAVVVAGVALAGLFTAGVASILIERSLRSRQVTSIEMSGHLVLCNWAPRGLEWVREVHSSIVKEKRPVVIIHDNPEDIELPEKQDDPAFNDI